MYINFWYPIARAAEITAEQPLQARVLGLKLVAFRDSAGEAHVLSDTCVHRGGSLGRGRVHDDCIACPYHGWRYAGDGRCRLIPAVGERVRPPTRARVDSYPVQERYGITFAFLGDLPEVERPPLYEIPEFGHEGWRESAIEVIDLRAYYERSMENGLDPAHNEFVHPSQGSPKTRPEVLRDRLKLVDLEWGTRFWIPFAEQHEWGTELGDVRAVPEELGAGTGHHGPNVLTTWINFSAKNAFHQYMFEQPQDDTNTRVFFLNMRNCMLDPKLDGQAYLANMTAISEDRVIVEELSPVRSPQSTSRELLVPGDQAVLRFREYLRRWEARGWRIDRRRVRETEGDVAWAIPSPARRGPGNWVLEAVPLVPAGGAATAPGASGQIERFPDLGG
jgi:phenylpropionate dioxygenase-like ring-hydroxylating dioxygenase large terminal subunit